MTTTSPSPPLGKYPQLREWGHVGAEPSAITTRTMRKSVRSMSNANCSVRAVGGSWGRRRATPRIVREGPSSYRQRSRARTRVCTPRNGLEGSRRSTRARVRREGHHESVPSTMTGERQTALCSDRRSFRRRDAPIGQGCHTGASRHIHRRDVQPCSLRFLRRPSCTFGAVRDWQRPGPARSNRVEVRTVQPNSA